MRQYFVIDFDEFGGVLGQCARIGDDCGHPFAAVAHHIFRQCITLHVGGIDAADEGISGGVKLSAGQHVMHTR